MKSSVFSIGYGNRDVDIFFNLLSEYDIKFLIDVRTNPFSKFFPDYSRKALEDVSRSYGIKYVFMGDDLGGKPLDRTCYDKDGHVIYKEIMKKEFFTRSAKRLLTANSKGIKIACMCSELNPQDCHRTKLIGEYLYENGVEICHIKKDGQLVSHKIVMNEITGGLNTHDIFGNEIVLKSKGTY